MKNLKLNEQQFIIRELEGETIFINTQAGDSHVIDDVGTIMYKVILQMDEIHDVLKKLLQIFSDVTQTELSNDVSEFIEYLLDKEIFILK